jgi:hypothetical protein
LAVQTWYAKTSPRLEALGLEVSHAISDRAKALIKLAVTGFECDSGADLLHAQQDLSRWLGSKLARHASTVEKHLIVAQDAEEKAPETSTTAKLKELKEHPLLPGRTTIKPGKPRRCIMKICKILAMQSILFPLSSSLADAEKIVERLETRAKAFEPNITIKNWSSHRIAPKENYRKIGNPETTPLFCAR